MYEFELHFVLNVGIPVQLVIHLMCCDNTNTFPQVFMSLTWWVDVSPAISSAWMFRSTYIDRMDV